MQVKPMQLETLSQEIVLDKWIETLAAASCNERIHLAASSELSAPNYIVQVAISLVMWTHQDKKLDE